MTAEATTPRWKKPSYWVLVVGTVAGLLALSQAFPAWEGLLQGLAGATGAGGIVGALLPGAK